MGNKEDRMLKETLSHFADPRYSRKAWGSVAWKILNAPAAKPGVVLDKNGEETLDSRIANYSYKQLSEDLAAIEHADGEHREPTELDMILACQIQHARHNTNAATFIRDTVGAKPVDESKLQAEITNSYETLSDEELELLAKLREGKLKVQKQDAQPQTQPTADSPAIPQPEQACSLGAAHTASHCSSEASVTQEEDNDD